MGGKQIGVAGRGFMMTVVTEAIKLFGARENISRKEQLPETDGVKWVKL